MKYQLYNNGVLHYLGENPVPLSEAIKQVMFLVAWDIRLCTGLHFPPSQVTLRHAIQAGYSLKPKKEK